MSNKVTVEIELDWDSMPKDVVGIWYRPNGAKVLLVKGDLCPPGVQVFYRPEKAWYEEITDATPCWLQLNSRRVPVFITGPEILYDSTWLRTSTNASYPADDVTPMTNDEIEAFKSGRVP